MPAFFSKNLKLIVLLLAGTLVWSLTMVKSGLSYSYGLGFWGANGHDGVWHLSLAASLAAGSFEMPIFAGYPIQNYHLGFTYLLVGLHRLTTLPISLLYFQILPPLFALLIGLLTYRYTRSWLSVFLVYFAGGLGWLVGGGESSFWSQQAVSTLINPPFALSLILLLVCLILLDHRRYFLAALAVFLVAHVKIYAGLLLVAGLLVAGFKKPVLLAVAGLAAAAYLFTNPGLLAGGSSLVVFSPGWFLETMMNFPDRLNWPRYYSAMVNYRLGGEYLKAAAAYFLALGAFLVGNLGVRVLALFSLRLRSWQNWLVWTMIAAGVAVPMLFVQSGTPWNTIQFFYYSQFLAAILAGRFAAKLSRLGLLAVFLLTLPPVYFSLQHYLPDRPPARIPAAEVSALNFLSDLPAGRVLVPPVVVDPYAPPPRPLYLYESTAYVSAYSGQKVFLEDEVNLDITGYPWRQRRDEVAAFFASRDAVSARRFLDTNLIRYLYIPAPSLLPALPPSGLGLRVLYSQAGTEVWGP